MAEKKKKKTYNLNSRLRSALRKLWMWSPMRAEALKRAKRGPRRFQCSSCNVIVAKPHVDHIVPCGPIDDLNAFRDRLFVRVEGLQVMCDECHYTKTQVDKILRNTRALSEKEAH